MNLQAGGRTCDHRDAAGMTQLDGGVGELREEHVFQRHDAGRVLLDDLRDPQVNREEALGEGLVRAHDDGAAGDGGEA